MEFVPAAQAATSGSDVDTRAVAERTPRTARKTRNVEPVEGAFWGEVATVRFESSPKHNDDLIALAPAGAGTVRRMALAVLLRCRVSNVAVLLRVC